jgi:hypothetical protein
MIQAPTWLPYRVRQKWDDARIAWALRGLDRTPPRRGTPVERAAAELYVLLCRRDVRLGVLTVKSLLRFPDARLAVTLTSDGSLSEADRAWVDRHLPGCRWLPRHADEPRVKAGLEPYPRLADVYYRSGYHPICKLVHPLLLARTERVIVVDPDTAFFRRPERLLRWAEGEGEHAWYLHDHQDEAVQVPAETREAMREIADRLTPPGQTWSMDYYFFNSGLLAYRPAQCDLRLTERYLEWRAGAPERYRTGKPGLWFGDWTPEQTSYLVMFALMTPASKPLGDDYHLGGDAGHVFNHFLRYYLVKPPTLRMLNRLVEECGRASP